MTNRWWTLRWCAAAATGAIAVFAGACGEGSFDEASFDSVADAGAFQDSAADGKGAPPEEREEESSFEAPVATGRHVWVANPKSGRVALIDAVTLDVRTVEAGNGPTHIAALASGEAAIVLNVLSEDATLLRLDGGGVTTTTFKTAPGMNAWATSPDGRWAIAWTDATKVPKADKTLGFQDLTILDVTGAVPPKVLAVGYRPVKVGFTGDPANIARAYAVTQDGVSIVDLTAVGGPLLVKNVPTSDGPLEDPGTRDVSVTPDGVYALVRRDGRADVTVVSLETGDRVTVTLPGPVTDLDLTQAGDMAVAVIRETSTVALLPVPGIFTDPATYTAVTIAGEAIGSVALAPDGSLGLLYTNATEAERLTLLSLAASPSPTYRTVRLYSPVLAVSTAHDARHAVVIHDVGTGITNGAFSLVPTRADLPAKIVATKARPTAVAFAPTHDRVIVSEGGPTTTAYGAYVGRLPELMVEHYPLASPPLAVGIMAVARRAYVAQLHPEGRITFIDLDNGRARTLTGFELASRVVDGSRP